MNNGAQQKNPSRQTKTVGICVINTTGKILLHKNVSTANLQWDLPHIAYDQIEKTAIQATSEYLQELGLTCDLHEVFTAHPHHPGGASVATPIEQVIIALPSAPTEDIVPDALNCTWSPIDKVLKDIQEKPAHYTPWLKTIIEGIELYLKNYLKNRSSDSPTVSL